MNNKKGNEHKEEIRIKISKNQDIVQNSDDNVKYLLLPISNYPFVEGKPSNEKTRKFSLLSSDKS